MVKEDKYADYYDRHLPAPGAPIRMLELGVQSGGSVRAWRQYYGSNLYYVGVDINPLCNRSHSPRENLHIEIGSQGDGAFLEQLCLKHGPFNVIIDDGQHNSEMIRASLEILFPSSKCMAAESVYAIEDTHTMMWHRFNEGNPSTIYSLAGEAWWSQHFYWAPRMKPGRTTYPGGRNGGSPTHPHPTFGRMVKGVHAYDSMLLIERSAQHRQMREIQRGTSKVAVQECLQSGLRPAPVVPDRMSCRPKTTGEIWQEKDARYPRVTTSSSTGAQKP